jgi:hypothetical protein
LDEERKREVRVKERAGSVSERQVRKSGVVESLGREGGLPGVFFVSAADTGLISARVKKSEKN